MTLLSGPQTAAEEHPQDLGLPVPLPAARRRVRAGVLTAAVGPVLLGLGGLTANPALVLVGLGSATTSLLQRRLKVDLAVPAAALVLLLASVSAGLAAAVVRIDLLAHPAVLFAGYLLYSLTALVMATRPWRPATARADGPSGRDWLGLVPTGIALATAVLQSVSVGVAKSWGFWGTDLTRHMTAIKALQESGNLDYGASSYPRGLHMLAALVSVPGRPVGRLALLGYDLRLGAALTWLALALLMWTGSVLAIRVSRRIGFHPAVAPVAAALLGAGALLTNTSLQSFVYLGAAPSLVAAAVLQGIPLALIARPHLPHRLAWTTLICAVATLALAHLWQALVLAPVLAWAVLAAPDLRRLPRDLRGRDTRRIFLIAAAGSLVAAALAVPPMFSVQQAAGLGYAAVPGELVGEPWRLLVPGLLAVAVVGIRRRREPWARACAATAIGLVGATVLLLRGTDDSLGLTQYYPLKALWFLAMFCAPLLAVMATAGGAGLMGRFWRAVGHLDRFAFVLRTTAVAVLLGPGLALWSGYLVGVESSTALAWHRAAPAPAGSQAVTDELSAVRYDVATRFGDPHGRVVVPWEVANAPFDHYGPMVVSLVLTFQTAQPEMRTGTTSVCDQVRWIAGARPAVVVTQLAADLVRQQLSRGGCAGQTRVKQVRSTGYLD
jgi:hypothetical protein